MKTLALVLLYVAMLGMFALVVFDGWNEYYVVEQIGTTVYSYEGPIQPVWLDGEICWYVEEGAFSVGDTVHIIDNRLVK
jgi:hypothetical protein